MKQKKKKKNQKKENLKKKIKFCFEGEKIV